MALRGSKPKDRKPRLKAMMFSPAGVGKTTAAIQMPRPYIIDAERGTEHYGPVIEKSGGVVFQTADFDEAVKEIRSLGSEKHNYLTVVIDPFTVLYDNKVDEGAGKVGTEWGRHYGYAATFCKRLFALLTQLDMNVIVTCHAKGEFVDGKQVGEKYDGWKKLDYLFDLVFELEKNPVGKRIATVRKTRLAEFPDGDRFEWSYDNLAAKYGKERLEADVEAIAFATAEQIAALKHLLETVRVEEDWMEKCLKKAGVAAAEDLTSDQAGKMVVSLEERLTKAKG